MRNISLLFLLAALLSGCSRDHEFWLDPENFDQAVKAVQYCRDFRAPIWEKPFEDFDRKQECPTVQSVADNIMEKKLFLDMEQVSIEKLVYEWSDCAVYRYPKTGRFDCAKMSSLVERRILEVIPDIESWRDEQVLEARDGCNSGFSFGSNEQGQERKDYCAALKFAKDGVVERLDAEAIAAWRTKIDEFVAMPVAEYQGLKETPCGPRGSARYDLNLRVTGSRIYDWTECSAWIAAERLRNRS